MAKLSDTGIMIVCFREQGVDIVFGYPGGAILNTYDVPRKHRDEVRRVLTSHEQGAAHAVGDYARVGDKVGVCLATSGPGATNLITSIASAYIDSLPIVAVTYNVTSPILRENSFQGINITDISMLITKYNFIVEGAQKFTGVLHRTFQIMRSGHPGPMLVDITEDTTAAVTDYRAALSATEALRPLSAEERIKEAFALLKIVKKSCIMASGGIILSNAAEAPAALVRRLDAPVCCTLVDQGAFNQSNPLYTGTVGMHGTRALNYMVSDRDSFVVVDARFSGRVAGSPK